MKLMVNFDLTSLVIEVDGVEISIEFEKLEDVARMIKVLRYIGRHVSGKTSYNTWRLFHKTIATVDIETIERWPICIEEAGKEITGCEWAHDFRSFLKIR